MNKSSERQSQVTRYFEALGIVLGTEHGKQQLTEAYQKAHKIRRFEIEMYWRRTAYVWTIQAAGLAGLALILSNTGSFDEACMRSFIEKTDKNGIVCLREYLSVAIIAAIWAFGIFSAFVWVLLGSGFIART